MGIYKLIELALKGKMTEWDWWLAHYRMTYFSPFCILHHSCCTLQFGTKTESEKNKKKTF